MLISKALIDSYISHDKFISVNNVLQDCNKMKKEIKKVLKLLRNTLYKYGCCKQKNEGKKGCRNIR